MKPKRFKPGDKITPNTKQWILTWEIPTPKFGKIYTVAGYKEPNFLSPYNYVVLEGDTEGWNDEKFDLVVISDEQIVALIEETLSQEV